MGRQAGAVAPLACDANRENGVVAADGDFIPHHPVHAPHSTHHSHALATLRLLAAFALMAHAAAHHAHHAAHPHSTHSLTAFRFFAAFALMVHPAHHALGHFWQHPGERPAAHDELRADGAPAEIRPHIQPFAGCEHDIGLDHRLLQQPTVDPDHGDGRTVIPGQLVNPRIGAVEHTQPVGAASHVEAEVGTAIH